MIKVLTCRRVYSDGFDFESIFKKISKNDKQNSKFFNDFEDEGEYNDLN